MNKTKFSISPLFSTCIPYFHKYHFQMRSPKVVDKASLLSFKCSSSSTNSTLMPFFRFYLPCSITVSPVPRAMSLCSIKTSTGTSLSASVEQIIIHRQVLCFPAPVISPCTISPHWNALPKSLALKLRTHPQESANWQALCFRSALLSPPPLPNLSNTLYFSQIQIQKHVYLFDTMCQFLTSIKLSYVYSHILHKKNLWYQHLAIKILYRCHNKITFSVQRILT